MLKTFADEHDDISNEDKGLGGDDSATDVTTKFMAVTKCVLIFYFKN